MILSIIWLIVWLVKGTPDLHQWNAWLISLIIVLALDLLGGGSSIKARL